jgi:hypothetical protein
MRHGLSAEDAQTDLDVALLKMVGKRAAMAASVAITVGEDRDGFDPRRHLVLERQQTGCAASSPREKASRLMTGGFPRQIREIGMCGRQRPVPVCTPRDCRIVSVARILSHATTRRGAMKNGWWERYT